MASRWSSPSIFLPYYIGFIRWIIYILLKLVPCIFYKQYTEKYINNAKLQERIDNAKNIENNKPVTDKFEATKYTNNDVTVVIPVYEPPKTFRKNILSIAKSKPYEIIIIADMTCYNEILKQIRGIDFYISVYSEERPGKRPALECGLKKTKTRLCCFTDDDVQWCDDFLTNLIIPFNLKEIGGVSSRQLMRSADISRKPNIYEIMASLRLETRYVENKAMTVVDKGTSCLSGRSSCYKTNIIQNEKFYHEFLNEYFLGQKRASGDDKFVTRYILNNGYNTYHQLNTNCTLTTTFESGLMHFKQSLRWSRNTIVSDFSLLFKEKNVWRKNPYTALLLFDKMFSPLYMLYGLFVIPIYTILQKDYVLFFGWIIWLMFSRGLKLISHFAKHPKDLIYLPIFIFYQYLMVILKIYALCTIHNRTWGNRATTVVNNEIVRTGTNATVTDTNIINANNPKNINYDPENIDYDADIEDSYNHIKDTGLVLDTKSQFYNGTNEKNNIKVKKSPKIYPKMHTISLD